MLSILDEEYDRKNPEEDLEILEAKTKLKKQNIDRKITMTMKMKMKTYDKKEEDDNAVEAITPKIFAQ